MTGKVPSGLSDDLHPNIVPRHSRYLAPIMHILLGFVQSVEVSNAAIAVMFACRYHV